MTNNEVQQPEYQISLTVKDHEAQVRWQGYLDGVAQAFRRQEAARLQAEPTPPPAKRWRNLLSYILK